MELDSLLFLGISWAQFLGFKHLYLEFASELKLKKKKSWNTTVHTADGWGGTHTLEYCCLHAQERKYLYKSLCGSMSKLHVHAYVRRESNF